MSMKSRIEELEARNRRQMNYIQDLKSRQDKAINALCDLAAGYGRKKFTDVTLAQQQMMMNLAAEELATVAKMPLRAVI